MQIKGCFGRWGEIAVGILGGFFVGTGVIFVWDYLGDCFYSLRKIFLLEQGGICVTFGILGEA